MGRSRSLRHGRFARLGACRQLPLADQRGHRAECEDAKKDPPGQPRQRMSSMPTARCESTP